MTISLAELTRRMSNKPIEEMLQCAESYGEFVKCIEGAGSEIIDGMDDDQLSFAVALLQSNVAAIMMEEGSISLSSLKFIVSDDFRILVGLIFKLSVGLAAYEELR